MKMKRGTDHWWEVRKYWADYALYAHCKCGFQYVCSSEIKDENQDGTWTWREKINKIYPYCPHCGARKKWYNEKPKKIEKYSWE